MVSSRQKGVCLTLLVGNRKKIMKNFGSRRLNWISLGILNLKLDKTKRLGALALSLFFFAKYTSRFMEGVKFYDSIQNL